MAMNHCLACYRDIAMWDFKRDCLHQKAVLPNPYWISKEYIRAQEREVKHFFDMLKNFTLPNIL